MTKLRQTAKQLGEAIGRAISEHGAPNTFGFAELHAYNGGPPPLLAGRAARQAWAQVVEACPYELIHLNKQGRIEVGFLL